MIRNYLKGKRVLITGGPRGLGFCLAQEFLRQGSLVAICAESSEELSEAMKKTRKPYRDRLFAFRCDITDHADLQRLIGGIRKALGRIDVLVNNTGGLSDAPMQSGLFEDYESAMNTQYWAPVRAALEVIPEMRARRDGRIVNISWMGSKIGVPHLLPYHASKFALSGFTNGLRDELIKDRVKVTSVSYFPMNEARAARKIVNACRRGSPEVVLSMGAKLALLLRELFPGMAARFSRWSRFLLPPVALPKKVSRKEELSARFAELAARKRF